MFDQNQLNALSAVIRCGNFERAAFEIGVTPSAISQRIKALEEQTGVILVTRGSPCIATNAGEKLAKLANEMRHMNMAVAHDLGLTSISDQKHIAIAVNADSLACWFLDCLSALDPSLLIDIIVDDQDVSDGWLRNGRVAAAISANSAQIQGCDRIKLGDFAYIACCTPAFYAAHFKEKSLAEAVKTAPYIRYGVKDALLENWSKQLLGKAYATPCHTIPTTDGVLAGTLAGLGWAINPVGLAEDHMTTGKLVAISKEELLITLYWHVSRQMKELLSPLTRATKAKFVLS